MKSFLALLAVVAVAAADVSHILKPRSGDRDAVILKQNADVSPVGYSYEVETSNGISAQETGQLVNAGTQNEALSVVGSNAYTNPEGQQIQLSYVADANGFQPQGAHLPTTPPPQPIPDYIQRAIAYILAHPPKEELRRV